MPPLAPPGGASDVVASFDGLSWRRPQASSDPPPRHSEGAQHPPAWLQVPLKRFARRAKACHERTLRSGAALTTTLSFQFALGETPARATSAEVLPDRWPGSDPDLEGLLACVRREFSRVRFPEAPPGPLQVSGYHLTLSPE